MEWKTHGERRIYTDKWVNLCLIDVQQPDGTGGTTTSSASGTWPWPPWSMTACRRRIHCAAP